MLFEKALKTVSKSAPGSDNDFADQLNFRYTAGIYLLCGLAVISRYYVSDGIQCWTPTYFAGAWIDYTNNLCFIKNTYYLPMDIPLEKGREEKLDYKITYYQWIPLFFMWLAMCFYIPRAIWFNVFSHHFVDINAIVDLLTSFDNAVNPETRDPAVQQVAKHIHRYLLNSTEYRKHVFCEARKSVSKRSKTFMFYIGRRYGLQVTLVYLTIKTLYIFVGLTQLYWIDKFLRGKEAENMSMTNYYTNILSSSYVFHVMSRLINGTDWDNSPSFPRVTMCDFDTRALGQNQEYSIQCVLPINLFNEKIFLFLYCWILLVMLITTCNLFLWIYRTAFACSRQKYIMKHLTLMGKNDERNRKYSARVTTRLMMSFIHDYLRPDGIFLLRLIAINTNCLITSEIIGNLWDEFRDDEKTQKKAELLNLKYRQKYGSVGAVSYSGSGMGNDDNYSSSQDRNDRIVIKKRSQKAFSIFQPNLDDSQATPMSMKELTDLRKFQNSVRDKNGGSALKVGFQEPGNEPRDKKRKKTSSFVCIDCEDEDNISEYGPMFDIDAPVQRGKPAKGKPEGFAKKMKKLKTWFVYDSSLSESDYSDEAPDNVQQYREPKRKRGKKQHLLNTCLADDGESDEDRVPAGSIRSVNTSNQEHRQETIPTNHRPVGFSGVQPPAYTQAAVIPNLSGDNRRTPGMYNGLEV